MQRLPLLTVFVRHFTRNTLFLSLGNAEHWARILKRNSFRDVARRQCGVQISPRCTSQCWFIETLTATSYEMSCSLSPNSLAPSFDGWVHGACSCRIEFIFCNYPWFANSFLWQIWLINYMLISSFYVRANSRRLRNC